MDFFEQQAQARRQTHLLIWLFALAVLAVIVVNYFIFGTLVLAFYKPLPHFRGTQSFVAKILLLISEILMHPRHYLHWVWDAPLAGWIALGSMISITLGCFQNMRFLASGGPAVAQLLGGRRVVPEAPVFEEQQLRNVVEEMAIASGMPVPETYVLDRERGVNTFAAGHTQEDVAIGVTYGALKLLTRDELQGVIAHEFSHVLNGDTRLNMRLIVLAHGLSWPTIVGRIALRGTNYGPVTGESIFDDKTSPVRAPLVPVAIFFLAVGSISLPLVRLIKSLICREREWLADAAAVQFTRDPAGIVGALKKIGGLLKQGRLDTPWAEMASHLYFVNSAHERWLGFQSTHPSLVKRIRAIDPGFDGKFQRIWSVPSREAAYDARYEESLRRARIEAGVHPDGGATGA
jgi:Zn-dependent protease with chaperone function